MQYGIKNTKTGKWFGGFDAARNVVWVGEFSAQAMQKLHAQAQASLLRRNGVTVQNKPVKLS